MISLKRISEGFFIKLKKSSLWKIFLKQIFKAASSSFLFIYFFKQILNFNSFQSNF